MPGGCLRLRVSATRKDPIAAIARERSLRSCTRLGTLRIKLESAVNRCESDTLNGLWLLTHEHPIIKRDMEGVMHRRSLCLLMLAGFAVAALATETLKHSVKPKDGFVPDSKTAVRIAVAVWEPIYGEGNIAEQKPYRARLADGVWTVEGSLPSLAPGQGVMVGGVALAEIAKEDGRVLRVSHGK